MQVFSDMLSSHAPLFAEFQTVHDNYMQDPKEYETEFNQKGQIVLRIIQRYDSMLCSKSEAGKYGKFSNKLSDKFWEAVRGKFPKIDMVGVISS